MLTTTNRVLNGAKRILSINQRLRQTSQINKLNKEEIKLSESLNTECKVKVQQKWINDLPKLPIPALERTIERYLDGMKAILPYSEFQETKKNVEQFLASDEANQLQKSLEIYAIGKNNWATKISLNETYFKCRHPLPVTSNSTYLFPRERFDQINQMFQYAAHFIQFALDFKQQIDCQSLSQDMAKIPCPLQTGVRLQPLCMQTYKNFFIAHRVPGLEKDALLIDTKNSNYIVVACRNQFFLLSLENEEIPMETYLIRRLQDIWNYGQHEETEKTETKPSFPVGIFTTQHRKTWFHIHQNLLKKLVNAQNLRNIEQALLIVCLDDASNIPNDELSETHQFARIMHGSIDFRANRWYDKFMNVIIGSDGVCGVLTEHSASEGITVTRFAEAFLEHWNEVKLQQPLKSVKPNQTTMRMNKSVQQLDEKQEMVDHDNLLHWKLDEYDRNCLEEADQKLKSLIQSVDLHVLHFKHFGRKWIKHVHFSPDAFIQVALQVTFYKMYGKLTSSYESASLRHFHQGRLEVIRSNTPEALILARSICNELPNITQEHKQQYLKKAIEKQVDVMNYVLAGQGIDNHLYAIHEMAQQKGTNLPQIFTQNSHRQFTKFGLVSSQVPLRQNLIPGYGPVDSEGHGCCYSLQTNQIDCLISSFQVLDQQKSRSKLFAFVLEESLLQMQQLAFKK